jgi:hypothetical protein
MRGHVELKSVYWIMGITALVVLEAYYREAKGESLLAFLDVWTAALIVVIAAAGWALLVFATRKKLRVERIGDSVEISVDDRRPRVERGERIVIHYDGQRVEIPPDWRLAAPDFLLTRWRTGGAFGQPSVAHMSIKIGDRILYQGTQEDAERVMAEIRKHLK